MPARTDDTRDPELIRALLIMRRGQAYWARKLNELPFDQFDAPSLLPGWSRRHLIAHVAYNARAVARLVSWARTGIETPMYASDTQRAEEIEFGATLSVEALLNLAAHAAVHLNVEWRDLPEQAWNYEVRTAQGRLVPASETVWMRTREVWIHALDLDNGASVYDFPVEVVDALLEDVPRVWRRKLPETDRDIVLVPHDRPASVSVRGGRADALVVHGSAVDLVGWGIGRTTGGVTTATGGMPPRAPDWL